MRFGVHQAIHCIALEMVREISHAFFSDLREISRCEIVPTRNPPTPVSNAPQVRGPGVHHNIAALHQPFCEERPPGNQEQMPVKPGNKNKEAALRDKLLQSVLGMRCHRRAIAGPGIVH